MVQALLTILVCLVAAYFFGELLHKLKIPKIVGQVGAGLFLGTGLIRAVLFDANSLEALSFLAHLGIILLFYYVGLEVDFKTMFKTAYRPILVSIVNTIMPFLLGFLSSYFLLDLEFLPSLIIGLSLPISAQSISINLLEELKLLKTKIGTLILSVGMFDDILELLIITGVLSVIQLGQNQWALLTLFLDMGIFLLAILAARLWFIPFILAFFERQRSSTARFTASMVIVLLIASLSEVLGLGLIIGALVAGMVVRQTIFKDKILSTWQEQDIANSVHIVAFGFLIPLFFVWVGLSVNLSLAFREIWLIILLFILAMGGTIGGAIIAMLLTKGTVKEGLLLGLGLSPKGDIELVIAALALQATLITPSIFTALVMMSMLTTIVSPIFFTSLSNRYLKRQKVNG